MSPIRLVLVFWLDARGVTQDWDEGDFSGPAELCEVQSLGWLTYEDERCIRVTPHMTRQGDCQGCGSMVIPRVCVQSIVELKEKS